MPIAWLATLPKAARSFYPIAVSGAAKGLSANSILAAYKAAGPGIRRKLGLEIVRRVKDIEKKTAIFKYIRKDFLPDPNTIPHALTSLLRKYSYKLSYEGVLESGETKRKYVTVSTDRLITPNEAISVGESYLRELPEAYEIEQYGGVSFVGLLQQ